MISPPVAAKGLLPDAADRQYQAEPSFIIGRRAAEQKLVSAGFRSLSGLTHTEPDRTWPGLTLFAPMYGRNVWLIDMDGTIVHRWATENLPGNYGELLPDGKLLFAGRTMPPAIPEFAGNGGQLVEYDWDGSIVWEYRDPYLSHCFAKLANGNVLVAKWRAAPDEIGRRVRGGRAGTERDGKVYGEAVQEIDRQGNIVWEWLTFEHLDPEIDVIGPLHPRDRWTNLNALHEMPDGRLLMSFRCINTIVIVDRATGAIDWRWGPGQIAGQHNPTWLENGNVLVFDNGAHRANTTIDYSRVIEVDPKNGDIVWEYKENPVYDFSSFICSGAQRLPNGNTLICECTKGRLFEVTREGDTVWEFVSPFYYEHPIFGTNNMVFRCSRYAEDDARFVGAPLDAQAHVDFNAMMPRRMIRSPNAAKALGTSYASGAAVEGGH